MCLCETHCPGGVSHQFAWGAAKLSEKVSRDVRYRSDSIVATRPDPYRAQNQENLEIPFSESKIGNTKSTVNSGSWSTIKLPSRRSDNRTLFCQNPEVAAFEELAKRYSWRDT